MTKNENKIFKDNLVIDAAPLIDFLCDVGVVEVVQNKIINNPRVANLIISPITLTEIYYVICREKGEKIAKESIDLITKSVKVELEFNIRELAGKYKCERTLSLADCYVLATAKVNSAIAIFKKEQELLNEMKKAPFDLIIFFVD